MNDDRDPVRSQSNVELKTGRAFIERARESDLVERLITAAKKDQKGVLGVKDTLLALQEGRVWQLVYSEGFRVAGAECTNCTAF